MRMDYSALGPTGPLAGIEASLRVGIVPTPDFTLFSLSCFVEFLRLSADESDHSRQIYCSWELLSASQAPIRSSCGFELTPTQVFDDPARYDYIVVHGGVLHSDTPIPQGIYDFIAAAVTAGVVVVGSCTGQFLLAEMGYLSQHKCAVHFSLATALTERFTDITPVTDAPVVVDGGFITCPGGLASLNLAMHLVAEGCGKPRAYKAMHYLMADRSLDALQSLKQDPEIGLNCPDQRVVNAVGLMRQRLSDPGTLSDLCMRLGVTEKELSRLFKKHLRTSPADYWRKMRLKSAHWMVLNSSLPITRIAHESGFTDSSHMIHWFKRIYKSTPSKLRRVNAEFGVH